MMRTQLRKLWADQRGDVNSLSIVLITVVLALGAIVGLTTLRDQIVQEMGDLAAALTHLDQSYSSTIGVYEDLTITFDDPATMAPAGLDLEVAASPE